MAKEEALVAYNDFLADCSARVVGSDGVICEVPIDLADDVRALKRQIQAKGGVPELQQHLYIGSTRLLNRELLSSLIIIGGVLEIQLTKRRPEVVDWLKQVREDTTKKNKTPCLEKAPADLLSDEGFMFAAVQEHRLALRFASAELKADRSIVKAAIQNYGVALRFASASLRDDSEIALTAVSQDGWALEHVSERLQEDRAIAFAAVQENGSAFEFVGQSLRSDRNLALVALRGSGMMLKEVAADLQKDCDLVMAAVQQDSEIFQFVEPEFRADRNIALAAIKNQHPRAATTEYGKAFQHVGPELLEDREFLMDALRAVGNCFRYLPYDLRDRELAMVAIQQDGLVLQCLSPDDQDLEICLAAVRQKRGALKFVSPKLLDSVATAAGISASARNDNIKPELGRGGARRRKDPRLLKHFKTLGLEEKATPEEIRKRYRELALLTHPDKQRGNPDDAKNQFALISNAYQAIKEELQLA
mmetsp:Transcript_155654/g.290525  ORF Transcript_155654/g.290525 Transcript_155654/m.290525 type:complete len:476 (-) Transcript_155654:239-1666(-)